MRSWRPLRRRIDDLVIIRLVLASFAYLLFAPLFASPATDGSAELDAVFARIDTMTGRFTQVSAGDDGTTRRLDGVFAVARPGRFRWEIRVPYQQTIVADGRRLMIYDRDLEQLMIRPMATSSMSAGPAALLSSDRPVSEVFDVVRIETEASGRRWYTLAPKRDDGEFDRLRLALDGRTIARIDVVDRMGGRTEIRFASVRYNVPVDARLFRLDPPPGTEVVDETRP